MYKSKKLSIWDRKHALKEAGHSCTEIAPKQFTRKLQGPENGVESFRRPIKIHSTLFTSLQATLGSSLSVTVPDPVRHDEYNAFHKKAEFETMV